MTITLESSIIHILNTAEEYPILSNRPFPLDSEVKDYLTKTIEKTISIYYSLQITPRAMLSHAPLLQS